MIHVISTGVQAPTKHICRASVASQRGVEVAHHYVESEPDVTRLENWTRVIAPLEPTDIVCILDGDDWLAHRHALSVVKAAHDAGAWVTWGSYMTADGEAGIAAPYDDDDDIRAVPWRATHLKTFRAGLFQQLTEAETHHEGRWIEHAPDMAIMLPMIEMAGLRRCMFVEGVLYVYNLGNSWERANPGRGAELEAEAIIRAKRPRERVTSL